MFPIRDENPTTHASVATFFIIGINVLCWIFVQGLGFGNAMARSVCIFGFIPGEFLGTLAPGTQIPVGHGLACVIDAGGSWFTPLTSMFMHGGWLHLIGNMWFLAVFGDNVEDAFGSAKFVLFYILCGLAAAAAQALSNPASPFPMIGASGAIGGVMGAYAILYPRAPVHMLVFLGFFVTRIVVPAFFMLGYWFLLQLVEVLFAAGGTGGVAVWAHIGGFLAGLLLLRVFCSSRRMQDCRKRRGRAERIIRRYARNR